MNSENYSTVRFIGYAIPTGPRHEHLALGKYLKGEYLGSADFEEDIFARVTILKNAVDSAKNALPVDEDITGVNNVFLAPEFFFHGALGPYIYTSGMQDPSERILELLAETFDAKNYPNWTFIFGTVVTAQVENIERLFSSVAVTSRKALVQNLVTSAQLEVGNNRVVTERLIDSFLNDLRVNPALEVRDRALVFSNIALSAPSNAFSVKALTTEKYLVSPIDFLLIERSNKDVVTEEMIAYPNVDLSNGDIKIKPTDSYSIFRQNYGTQDQVNYLDFGVEICLDHDDARLRQNMTRQPFPQPTDTVHIQIVPSCGSAIVAGSVVAGRSGFVFNCDGFFCFGNASVPQADNISGVQCIYTDYAIKKGAVSYQAHTQLARVATPARGNNPFLSTATFEILETTDVMCVDLTAPILRSGEVDDYFAGGIGCVHIYGHTTPFPLYLPQVAADADT